MCPTIDGIEDTEHFLLLHPSFDAQRRDLIAGIFELILPFIQINDLEDDSLTQLELYGDQDLSYDLSRNIPALTLLSSPKVVSLIEIFCNVSSKQPLSPYTVNILLPCNSLPHYVKSNS